MSARGRARLRHPSRAVGPAVALGAALGLVLVAPGGTAGADVRAPAAPVVSANPVADAFPDFDADGYGDLVIGSPGGASTGLAYVLSGSPGGLSASRGLTIRPDDLEGGGTYSGDFGTTVVSGDFDGDGHDDSAIAAPNDFVGGDSQAGAVRALYGSATGLGVARNQLWTLDGDLVGEADDYEHFGWDLAAGDFDGDGRDDLAVMVKETFEGLSPSARILYGTPDGLSAVGAGQLGLALTSISTVSLVAGDLDGDGADELVVGESYGGPGRVSVYPGGADGLGVDPVAVVDQGTDGVEGRARRGEGFATSVAVGDMDADGYDDLVVGIAKDERRKRVPTTAVQVIRGGPDGVTGDGGDLLKLRPLRGELPTLGGWVSVAVGDVDGDGAPDVVAGHPSADVEVPDGPVVDQAGAVLVIRGTGVEGRLERVAQVWTQDSPLVEDAPEEDDSLGYGLALVDHDADGRADLTVGVYGEDGWGGFDLDTGVAHTLRGSTEGVTGSGARFWYVGMPGLEGPVGVDDYFGLGLG